MRSRSRQKSMSRMRSRSRRKPRSTLSCMVEQASGRGPRATTQRMALQRLTDNIHLGCTASVCVDVAIHALLPQCTLHYLARKRYLTSRRLHALPSDSKRIRSKFANRTEEPSSIITVLPLLILSQTLSLTCSRCCIHTRKELLKPYTETSLDFLLPF